MSGAVALLVGTVLCLGCCVATFFFPLFSWSKTGDIQFDIVKVTGTAEFDFGLMNLCFDYKFSAVDGILKYNSPKVCNTFAFSLQNVSLSPSNAMCPAQKPFIDAAIILTGITAFFCFASGLGSLCHLCRPRIENAYGFVCITSFTTLTSIATLALSLGVFMSWFPCRTGGDSDMNTFYSTLYTFLQNDRTFKHGFYFQVAAVVLSLAANGGAAESLRSARREQRERNQQPTVIVVQSGSAASSPTQQDQWAANNNQHFVPSYASSTMHTVNDVDDDHPSSNYSAME